MTYPFTRIVSDLAPMLLPEGEATPRMERLAALYLPDAAEAVLAENPAEAMTLRRQLDGPIYRIGGRPGVGQIPLPDDFMTLCAFLIRGWRHTVTRLITPEDPDYAMRYSPWPELAGSPDRPRCYLVRHPAGDRLEFSAALSDAPEHLVPVAALYMPRPVLADGAIRLPHSLYVKVLERLALGVAERISKTITPAAS